MIFFKDGITEFLFATVGNYKSIDQANITRENFFLFKFP